MAQGICDKCDGAVESKMDAAILDSMAFGSSHYKVTSRHLFPVKEGDVQICEGSPSRAQYIQGWPRDTRGYPYLPEYEVKIREAYQRLQDAR